MYSIDVLPSDEVSYASNFKAVIDKPELIGRDVQR